MNHKRLGLFTVILAALTGCTSTSATPVSGSVSTPAAALATATTETASASRTPTPPTRTPAPTPTPTFTRVAGVGDVAINGGIHIKVISAIASPAVTLNTSHYRSGSGYEIYENVQAQAGGKYVIVETMVTNNAKAPIDLTCSFPIDFKVLNSSSQVYSPIQKLYQIKGNPECNAQLQPGFESFMIWAFLVPEGSTIDGATFREVDFAARGAQIPTFISFGAGVN